MSETAFNKPEPPIDAKLLRIWKEVAKVVRADPNPKACCQISANHLDALVDAYMERAAFIVTERDAAAIEADRDRWRREAMAARKLLNKAGHANIIMVTESLRNQYEDARAANGETA